MTVAVNKLQSDGYEIILSLDANETIGQDKTADGIASLMESCTLQDLHLLSASAPPATYKYGTARRIDFMLGSASVADHVCKAGYLAYDEGFFSKHRGLFVDINFQALMCSVESIPPIGAGYSL